MQYDQTSILFTFISSQIKSRLFFGYPSENHENQGSDCYFEINLRLSQRQILSINSSYVESCSLQIKNIVKRMTWKMLNKKNEFSLWPFNRSLRELKTRHVPKPWGTVLYMIRIPLLLLVIGFVAILSVTSCLQNIIGHFLLSSLTDRLPPLQPLSRVVIQETENKIQGNI